MAAGLAAVAVAGAGIWAVTRQRSTAAPAYRLKPVNQDGAEVFNAAVSPDGKLIVYSSTRGGQSDLWIQHLAGGSPTRLTNSPEHEASPRFSPDGSQITFSRAQSIFVISTLGGSERPIPAEGATSSFSPDGTQLLVSNNPVVGRISPMVAVPLAGGAPRRIPLPREFTAISLWSPSGRYILVGTIQPGSTQNSLDRQWHIVGVAGGSSRPAGELEQAVGMFRRDSVRPVSWLKQSNHLIFAARKLGDQTEHIWRLEMDEDGRVASPPVQLTNGTGESPGPASDDGRLIPFVNRIRTSGIYSITLDSAGKGGAEPAPIAGLDGQASFAVVSRDGSQLVYAANASGSRDIWLRDMKAGTETVLIGSPADEVRGLLSPDGSKVAFQRSQDNKSVAYWATVPAGEEHRICDDCRSLLQWTPDGRAVLISQGKPERMVAYEIESGRRIPTVADPQFPVHDVTFSRDGRFLAFTVLRSPGDRSIYVARWDQSRETGPAEWNKVLDGGEMGRPFFSEDGNLLYYVKVHAGLYCLFGRRLHPATKVPQGEEIEIRHFHGDLKLPPQAMVGYGLAGNTLYLPLYQSRSSLWIAERAGE